MKPALPFAFATLLACASAPAPPVAEPPTQAAIEPSEGLGAPKTQLGDGDDEAQRCFVLAARDDAEAVVRCRDNEVEKCGDLARTLLKSHASCSAKIRALACDAEYARACAELADQLLAWPTAPATRVRKLLERACDGGVARACTRLAKLEHERVERYDANIVKLLERGCELGDGEACFIAAQRTHSYALDTDRATLYGRACDLGHDRACLVLGLALVQGLGPTGAHPDNQARGQQLLSGLCGGSGASAPEACFQLGLHTPTAQQSYFARACDKGHFNACIEILVGHHEAARHTQAIELATKMLVDEPDQWRPRWIRASALFNTGQHQQSIPDLEALLVLRIDWPLLELWLYAARERSGGDGKPGLQKALARVEESAWPFPVFQHMVGKMSAAQLLRAAKDKEPFKQRQQECEAYYYIGQQLMVRGQTTQAKAMFQKSVDTQITDYIEYSGAKAELVLLAR